MNEEKNTQKKHNNKMLVITMVTVYLVNALCCIVLSVLLGPKMYVLTAVIFAATSGALIGGLFGFIGARIRGEMKMAKEGITTASEVMRKVFFID